MSMSVSTIEHNQRFSPATDWRPIQGVSRLSLHDFWLPDSELDGGHGWMNPFTFFPNCLDYHDLDD